jgi:hypothetical protein
VVEPHVANVIVAGSNPVTRSTFLSTLLFRIYAATTIDLGNCTGQFSTADKKQLLFLRVKKSKIILCSLILSIILLTLELNATQRKARKLL